MKSIKDCCNKVFTSKTGSNNCQRCTCSFELLYGYNQLYKPITCNTPFEIVFDCVYKKDFWYKNWFLVKDLKKQDLFPIKTKTDVINIVKQYNNSRWICHTSFKGGKGGHVFNVINNNNKQYIVDATTNTIIDLSNKEDNFVFGYTEKGIIFRVDNKQPNIENLNNIFNNNYNNKNIYYTLCNNTKKYISVIDALKILGIKNKVYEVYKNNKNIGKIKCIDKTDESYCNKRFYVWEYKWL